MCYGLFTAFDHYSHFILHYVPYYHLFKLVFLVFLYHPWTQGASVIYNTLLLPNIDKYEAKVKKVINDALDKKKGK